MVLRVWMFCRSNPRKKRRSQAIVQHIKTCEFHFKESVNRHCRKLSSTNTKQFKDLSNQLLECITPEWYDNVKHQFMTLFSQEKEEDQLKEWLEWLLGFTARVHIQSINFSWVLHKPGQKH